MLVRGVVLVSHLTHQADTMQVQGKFQGLSSLWDTTSVAIAKHSYVSAYRLFIL